MKIFLFLEVTIVHISSLKGQFARDNLQKSPANAPAKRKKLFQNKNTSAQSTLDDTGSLNEADLGGY